MSQRMYQVRPSFGSALVGLLVAALFFYLLFRVAAFTVSTLVSGLPIFFGFGLVLLGAAYLIDKEVPLGFGRWLGATFRTEPFKAILLAIATVVFAPFVFGYLLVKAILLKRVRQTLGGFQERAEDAMRQQQARHGGASIGNEEPSFGSSNFEEVRRDDGLVIRIPKSDVQ